MRLIMPQERTSRGWVQVLSNWLVLVVGLKNFAAVAVVVELALSSLVKQQFVVVELALDYVLRIAKAVLARRKRGLELETLC